MMSQDEGLIALRDLRWGEALKIFEDVIRADPNNVVAWYGRGAATLGDGRPLDALLHFEAALGLDQKHVTSLTMRGLCFLHLRMWEMAERSFRDSLEVSPTLAAHMHLGNMYAQLMRLEEAEESYRQYLKMGDDDNIAVRLGQMLLGQGRWEEGLPHFMRRYDHLPPRAGRFPRWDGKPLDGRTLLLYGNEGFGDQICALRVIRDLPDAIIETNPPMRRLVEQLTDRVIDCREPYPPGIDCSFSMVDAMVLLRSPWRGPYIRGASGISSGMKKRVGICWSSGRRPLNVEYDAVASNKSVPLQTLIDAAAGCDVELVSLQKDWKGRHQSITDPMRDVCDFRDTADIIETLDLVITVDTAVAHLAGAMGKPVWNLVRFSGYWPWERQDGDTHWYPSMRVYRQKKLGDWIEPLAQIATDLKDFVGKCEGPHLICQRDGETSMSVTQPLPARFLGGPSTNLCFSQ